MTADSLTASIAGIKSVWGLLSTELVAGCRAQLEQLLRAPPTEPWLASLRLEEPSSRELYRDPTEGFMLLAHTEHAGLYRPPHDHGRSWVIYAIQDGEVEMGSYGRVEDAAGRVRLVKRDSTRVRAGEVQVYLPGDIHDTRCISGSALLYRFTERDLKEEDQEAHRLTRFVERDGVWTTPLWESLTA
jgi:hypothetical protein